jgi:hypothetical protein
VMLGPFLVTFGLLSVVFRILLCMVGEMGRDGKLTIDGENYCKHGVKRHGTENTFLNP